MRKQKILTNYIFNEPPVKTILINYSHNNECLRTANHAFN